eukprot:7621860-Lingulodinium_polyedra.AAC.1
MPCSVATRCPSFSSALPHHRPRFQLPENLRPRVCPRATFTMTSSPIRATMPRYMEPLRRSSALVPSCPAL